MTVRVVLSRLARADIDEIVECVEWAAGTKTADLFTSRFDAVFVRLAEHPTSGGLRPRFGEGIRIAVVAPYVVLYRFAIDDVSVMRVVHGRRDLRELEN